MDSVLAFLREYFVGVLIALALTAIAWFRTQIWRILVLWFTSIQRLNQARKSIKDDRPWLIKQPRDQNRVVQDQTPIITVANLKGGVGKTTITANLAAYFALETKSKRRPDQHRKVLIIDLDFQGSVSSMLLRRDRRIPTRGSLSDASQLLLGDLKEREVVRALPAAMLKNVQVIPAYYDLARTESRLQLQWMIGDESRDVRYTLSDILKSKAVQEAFDLIIIDAPPRLTTASIQALCASSHLVVPTILDLLSGEAVGSFVDQVEDLRPLWPDLKFVGVVATMVSENPMLGRPLKQSESDGVVAVETALKQVYERHNLNPMQNAVFPRETYIVDSEQIRQRAGTVAFAELGNDQSALAVKSAFRRLGAELERRM